MTITAATTVVLHNLGGNHRLAQSTLAREPECTLLFCHILVHATRRPLLQRREHPRPRAWFEEVPVLPQGIRHVHRAQERLQLAVNKKINACMQGVYLSSERGEKGFI
jgi:hypothetical protein